MVVFWGNTGNAGNTIGFTLTHLLYIAKIKKKFQDFNIKNYEKFSYFFIL